MSRPRPLPPRVIVGITGASGAILGIRAVQKLSEIGAEVHLVVSKWGQVTIAQETPHSVSEVRGMASCWYRDTDQGAAIASGSFAVDAMVVVPCSTRTAAAVAGGYGDNLVCRAADVALKEGRPLVLVVREAPLSIIHLRNMLTLAQAGATVFPASPSFYPHPKSLDDVVDYLVVRILDQVGLQCESRGRWRGLEAGAGKKGSRGE